MSDYERVLWWAASFVFPLLAGVLLPRQDDRYPYLRFIFAMLLTGAGVVASLAILSMVQP